MLLDQLFEWVPAPGTRQEILVDAPARLWSDSIGVTVTRRCSIPPPRPRGPSAFDTGTAIPMIAAIRTGR